MNTPSRSVQRLGALGIVYAVLYIVASAFTLNVPQAGAGAPQVITYYSSHFAPITASIFLMIAGSVVFLFFLSSLRRALDLSGESRVLSSVVTAGGAVYAAGLLVDALLANALLDAGHYHSVAAASAINVIAANDWAPVVAGLSAVALGTGVAALRGGGLPRWLAWASIVLGVLAVAGPLGEVALWVSPLWSVAVGITLMRPSGRAPAIPSADPSLAATAQRSG
jgi:hypothetical protein